MKFLDYLKTNDVIQAAQFTKLRDNSAMSGMTAFQFLSSKDQNEYSIPYSVLDRQCRDWGATLNIPIVSLENTVQLKCDSAVYKKMAAPLELVVKTLIPVSSEITGERLAITNRPDDPVLKARLAAAYAGQPYSLAICSPDLWRQLHGLFVEPILLEHLSSTISKATSGNISEAVLDSEARKFYTTIINAGVAKRASDLHIIPCSDHAEVKFRVDGVQHHYINIPLDTLEKTCNILKNDGKISVTHPNEPVDGKVRYSPSQGKIPDDGIDLRISIIPSKKGPSLNVRYLSSKLYTFDELGMTPASIQAFSEILDLPSGLVIQTGPTGSGKSTTLYAGLGYIHKSMRNIITAEDPVEILMDGIIQIDVSPDSRLDFASALKASLRHDPDVIVVGELRDEPTAALAVRAANTGHLVLTSLHTNDSVGTFERLINLKVDSYSIGEVVAAVMGQRLVRVLCPHCKEEYELDLSSEEARLYRFPQSEGKIKLYRAKGCVACDNTGYHGRVAINEILIIDPKLRNLIQRHATRQVIEEHLRECKFRTMYHDGLAKVIAGVTSLDEMTEFAKDTIAFKG